MEMTKEELGNYLKEELNKAIQPYLKVERPEGETGEKDKPMFESIGKFIQ